MRRWEWLLLLAVAFAVRIAAGITLGHFADPRPWEYEQIADNLLAGNGFVLQFLQTPYRALCPPGYPFLCAAVYAVTDYSRTALLLLQCLLGALICVPVHQIALLALRNPACAVLGSWAVALHPGLIQYASRLHTLTLDVLLFFLCLWSWMVFCQQASNRHAILTGLASGSAPLFRGTILPFVFLAAALSPRLTGLPARTLAPKLARIFLIVALLMTPWLIRNAVLFHRFPMLMSGSNYSFWLGNNPMASGGALLPDGQAIPTPEALLRERRQRDEMGQSQLFAEQSYAFLREQPMQALRLFVLKLRSFFWFSPQTGIRYPGWQVRLYRWYYGVIVVLALIGLIGTRQRWAEPSFMLLFLYLFSIALSQSLYYVEGRHRWIVEPILLLWAAQGALLLKQRIVSPS